MIVDDALDILQPALDRCRDNDIRTAGIFGTLNFLEGCTAVKCPFDNFRSALNSPRSSNQEKEALGKPSTPRSTAYAGAWMAQYQNRNSSCGGPNALPEVERSPQMSINPSCSHLKSVSLRIRL